ncbi:hypothetical protein Bbelb_212380 [Branchiostoma belcheri]|nr:hypothetical protein Bbelb_212380 [Branchiostoma belcheri]
MSVNSRRRLTQAAWPTDQLRTGYDLDKSGGEPCARGAPTDVTATKGLYYSFPRSRFFCGHGDSNEACRSCSEENSRRRVAEMDGNLKTASIGRLSEGRIGRLCLADIHESRGSGAFEVFPIQEQGGAGGSLFAEMLKRGGVQPCYCASSITTDDKPSSCTGRLGRI